MNDSLYFCMMCGAETVEEVERAVEEEAERERDKLEAAQTK